MEIITNKIYIHICELKQIILLTRGLTVAAIKIGVHTAPCFLVRYSNIW